MFSFFKKEKWVHLKTMEYGGIHFAKGHPHEKSNLSVYIHFYESDKGNRKIECFCSAPEVPKSAVDNYVRSSPTYQKRFIRWIDGRYDPEIPRYSDIGEEDTANALRGKIE